MSKREAAAFLAALEIIAATVLELRGIPPQD